MANDDTYLNELPFNVGDELAEEHLRDLQVLPPPPRNTWSSWMGMFTGSGASRKHGDGQTRKAGRPARGAAHEEEEDDNDSSGMELPTVMPAGSDDDCVIRRRTTTQRQTTTSGAGRRGAAAESKEPVQPVEHWSIRWSERLCEWIDRAACISGKLLDCTRRFQHRIRGKDDADEDDEDSARGDAESPFLRNIKEAVRGRAIEAGRLDRTHWHERLRQLVLFTRARFFLVATSIVLVASLLFAGEFAWRQYVDTVFARQFHTEQLRALFETVSSAERVQLTHAHLFGARDHLWIPAEVFTLPNDTRQNVRAARTCSLAPSCQLSGHQMTALYVRQSPAPQLYDSDGARHVRREHSPEIDLMGAAEHAAVVHALELPTDTGTPLWRTRLVPAPVLVRVPWMACAKTPLRCECVCAQRHLRWREPVVFYSRSGNTTDLKHVRVFTNVTRAEPVTSGAQAQVRALRRADDEEDTLVSRAAFNKMPNSLFVQARVFSISVPDTDPIGIELAARVEGPPAWCIHYCLNDGID
jgi:hypothetical protein